MGQIPYRSIILDDFSGGWVTMTGALALQRNQSPDMLNLIALPGRLRFRGGYQNVCALPDGADGAYPFYDSDNAKHFAVWCGGDLYDLISGTPVLVTASVYTAGSRIGRTDLNGILYWSCGQPNPVYMQYWDPVAATFGAVAASAGMGHIDPPASDYLFIYLNSIMALAPTWQSPTVYQPNVFAWCGTNDPSDWQAANSQAVGANNGGKVVFGIPFGIANTGIVPGRTFLIGRNDQGIWAYTGAMPTLTESILNCPVGCLAGESVQYIPTSGAFGVVNFLGTDGQIWQVNGVNAVIVSGNILDTISQAVSYALQLNPNQRFYSGYNEEWQYYWVDINGTQYAYRWQTSAWMKFQGWPTGPIFSTIGFTGAPVYYTAGNGASPYLSQIAMDHTFDNGVMPTTYYDTPYLHGGDLRLMKEFPWITIGAYDTGTLYSVKGTGNKRLDGSHMESDESMLQAPLTTNLDNAFILGSSLLGGPNVLTTTSPVVGGNPVIMQTVLACPVTETKFIPAGIKETLKANAMKLRIAYAGGTQAAYDILQIQAQFVPKGYMRGAGNQFNPTAGAPDNFDPFTAPVGPS